MKISILKVGISEDMNGNSEGPFETSSYQEVMWFSFCKRSFPLRNREVKR